MMTLSNVFRQSMHAWYRHPTHAYLTGGAYDAKKLDNAIDCVIDGINDTADVYGADIPEYEFIGWCIRGVMAHFNSQIDFNAWFERLHYYFSHLKEINKSYNDHADAKSDELQFIKLK